MAQEIPTGENKEDYVPEFVSHAGPKFVYKEAVPEVQRGRVLLGRLLMRAIYDGVTEMQIESHLPYKSARIIRITADGKSHECIAPGFGALFHHIQSLPTSPVRLNLDDMINEFLAEAYPSNRLGEEYIDGLRAVKIKNFTLSIEIDSATPKATLKLKALD